MIDVKEIQVLNTKKCSCGYEFSLKDFTKLENLSDTHGFYANIVKHYTMAKCPECKNEVILLLRQRGQTWEVMNTAKLNDATDIDVATINATAGLLQVESNVIENETDNVEVTTTMNSDEEEETSQEFICPVCEKVCKSQIGLTAHMKVHSN